MTAAMDVGRDRVITDLAGWLKATLPAGGQLRSDSRSVMPGDAFFAAVIEYVRVGPLGFCHGVNDGLNLDEFAVIH